MVKIVFDKKNCIGCGACAAICPENWEMDGSKAKCRNLNPKTVGGNKDAADTCPQNCIKVIEK